MKNARKQTKPVNQYIDLIYTIRGLRVMLDQDLARMYDVETRILNQQVKRHIDKFPSHFRFQLTNDEFRNLRSQTVTSKEWGGRRYAPYAFTEKGVLMLANVLPSRGASAVSVHIVESFVEITKLLAEDKELKQRMLEYEKQASEKDMVIRTVYHIFKQMKKDHLIS